MRRFPASRKDRFAGSGPCRNGRQGFGRRAVFASRACRNASGGCGEPAEEYRAPALNCSCMRRRADLGHRMELRMLFLPASTPFEGACRLLETAIRANRGNGREYVPVVRSERRYRIMATAARQANGQPDIADHSGAFRRDARYAAPSRRQKSKEIDRISKAPRSGPIPACRDRIRNRRSGSPDRPFELLAKPAPV